MVQEPVETLPAKYQEMVLMTSQASFKPLV